MQNQANFTCVGQKFFQQLLLAIFAPYFFAFLIMASTFFHNFF